MNQTTNETGRKTFLWYRVYLAVLAVIYLALIGLGVFLLLYQPPTRQYDPQELVIVSVAYIVLGIIFFLAFAIAFFLPPKPYNWVVGIVMMAIRMTSCCFIPLVVPLFIFWLKPETQAFFGRK